MESVYLSNRPRIAVPRPVIESSLWLRAGFVAMAIAAIGVVNLFSGEMRPLTALMLILVGGPAGVWSLRRSWQLLDGGGASPKVEARRRVGNRLVTHG